MSLAAFLHLHGGSALVVGGGKVALRRARTLFQAGLSVQVVAPETVPEFQQLGVSISRRGYQAGDVQGKRVVVAATDQSAVNDQVVADALAIGALVNHAGNAQQGNLRFPALAEQAGVKVAVSSGRELPFLAQLLAGRFAEALPTEAQLQEWVLARQNALSLSGEQREMALKLLRDDIQRVIIQRVIGGTA